MSEERLSRLQKWILEFLYNREGQTAYVTTLKYNARRSVGLFKEKANRASMAVTFSRSLRCLYYKDLIEASPTDPEKLPSGRCHGRRKNFADEGNIKWIFLTDEGKAKAKELLNVKNGELNNKKKKDAENDRT